MKTGESKSNIDLNNQKTKESIQKLMIDWDKIGIEQRKLGLEKIMTEYNTTISPELKATLGIIEQAVDGVLKKK